MVLGKLADLSPARALIRLLRRHNHDFHAFRRIEWDTIYSYLDARAGLVVLDLACGFGYYSHKLASRGCRAQGLDLDEKKVQRATDYYRHENCWFCVGNAEELPYSDGIFDRVVSVCAFEHFSDPQQALQEVARVVRADGRFVLSVDSFNLPGITPQDREYHRAKYRVQNYFGLDQLKGLLGYHPTQP